MPKLLFTTYRASINSLKEKQSKTANSSSWSALNEREAGSDSCASVGLSGVRAPQEDLFPGMIKGTHVILLRLFSKPTRRAHIQVLM